ncbi:MAG: SusC/RagA family TonB-linked outer membrane protein [Niabella sp.]
MRKIVMLSLLMAFSVFGFAQTKTVTGTVLDETGSAVPFASITQKGTDRGVSANADGNFSIDVRTGTVLVISATGFSDKEVTVGSQSSIVVSLTRGEGQLIEEVVVTASGLKINKREQGYASTTIKADKLVQAAPTNVTTALSGKVPGLQINGVNSGVNPNYSIVLRGYRSITGNNQALIVLDNVIVPNSVLGNLNPSDIADITTLNGASAAALYGSRAANGALIVTTKRGTAIGKPEITLSQTISAQAVGFYPGIQKQFGSGSDSYIQVYNAYENQQYGPKFDGSMVTIGEYPTPGGQIQTVPYAWNAKEGKLNFWKTALTSQTDFSVSAPTSDRGRIYFSAQYLDAKGTLQGDGYKRTALSIGGSQDISDKVNLDYSVRYTQNVYTQATNLSSIYDLVLNSPGQVPLTRYKNWQVDSFAMPNYYYNAFYNNPYFLKDNERTRTQNDYLVGNVSLKYSPAKWVDLLGRVGMTTRYWEGKNWQDVFLFNQYAKDHANGSYKKSDIKGSLSDFRGKEATLIGDFITTFRKTNIENFNFRANLGVQVIQDDGNNLAGNINGFAIPGLYNLSNQTSPPTAGGDMARSRSMGIWGELYATYHKYLTLHLTGRRDQVSVLDPEYNKFFYPSADLSFLASDAFSSIKNSTPINLLKIRVSTAKVGNVNLGAYRTLPIFFQASGYPYSGNVGYSVDNSIVTQGLKPEFTYSQEIGIDLEMWQSRLTASVTAYKSRTENQTLPVAIAPSTGFTSLLTNTGITSASGIEASLGVIPVQTENTEIGISINYTYNDNKVVELGIPDLDLFRLFSYGNGTGVYAAPGKGFPALYATTHLRDSASGKIIVDPITGYPTLDPTIKYMGRTQPLHRLGVNLDVRYKGLVFKSSC